MSLFITSLNSGSNANCYYIGNGKEAVLIDAGLSCRETEKRMTRLGLSMSIVKGIFISHEHADHITGIPGISKKHQLPVYITQPTFGNLHMPVEAHLVHSFVPKRPVMIGGLSITAFCKSHDASDPHSFIVSNQQVTVGIFTDIGYVCKEVSHYFKLCDAAFLESNYCNDMLDKGGYPYYLKQRIAGDKGHLSNLQALELFQRHRSKKLRCLILAHLSKNNNSPELVQRLFTEKAGDIQVVVASRYAETPVYEITPSRSLPIRHKKTANQSQLSLF